jgi:hypothetical protein
LRSNVRASDAIIHDNRLTFVPMRVVDPGFEQVWLPDVTGIGVDVLPPATQAVLGIPSTRVADAMAGHDRIWFVIFARSRDEYRASGFEDDPNWLAIDAQFDAMEMQSFGEVELVLFARSP